MKFFNPATTFLPFTFLLTFFCSSFLLQAQSGHDEAEHSAVMSLVPHSAANHKAVASGNWNSASTWQNGSIPGNGAKVHIPEGVTVTITHQDNASLAWIRVDGTLSFASNVNTKLTVETVVTTPTATLNIGTEDSPIAGNVTATIIIADNGAINTSWDPQVFSRGLLLHGATNMYGAAVTPFIQLTTGLAAGATELTLSETPTNWKVGDKIVVTATRMVHQNGWKSLDEERTITAIAGKVITVEALVNERKAEFEGLTPYVANLSRNIIIKSANTTDISRRGHVMLMHNPKVQIHNAGFYELGRTNKKVIVTDNGGSNPRGRYSVHVHKCGDYDINSTPAVVKGCAVSGSPGWGYVNHKSHAIFEDNVAFNILGSCFVTEDGTELGWFRRNIAIKTIGSGMLEKDGPRVRAHDVGHAGSGFWMQSGSIKVQDNVACGHPTSGFIYFTRGHRGEEFSAMNMTDPSMTGGKGSITVDEIPIQLFKGNTAHACDAGLTVIDVEINNRAPTRNWVEDFTALNPMGADGIRVEYSRNFKFKNVRLVRDADFGTASWHGGYGIRCHNLIDLREPDFNKRSPIVLDNVTVTNFDYAIHNYEGEGESGHGTCCGQKAKVEVWENSTHFSSIKKDDYTGPHLVNYVPRPDPDTQAPTTPGSLTSPGKTASSVLLSWGSSTDNRVVSGYYVYKGSTRVTATPVATTEYLVKGLNVNTAYTFMVKAVDQSGNESAASNSVSVTTTQTPASVTYLSDLNWTSANAGHGSVQKDKNTESEPLQLNSVPYPKGISANAPSTVIYDLGGNYSKFISDLGVDDKQKGCGSVGFEVYLDNVLSYSSGTLLPASFTKTVILDVAGKNQLKMVITTAGDNNYCDYGVWAGARLEQGTAVADNVAPAAPTGLTISSKTNTSVSLSWAAATDNVGVSGYDVYNGTTKVNSSLLTTTSFTVTGLTANTAYSFNVKTKDAAGNTSAASTAVSVTTEAATTTTLRNPENPATTTAGLDYKYYEGTWANLPNFASLTTVETGTVNNFDLSIKNRADNFAIQYQGYINVATDGEYTFYTSSDDGSKLYIGSTEVVSNDGLHGMQERSGTIGLKAGKHAITVAFLESAGGEGLTVSYAGPGISKTAVPASALFKTGTSGGSTDPDPTPGTLTKVTGTTFGTAPWTGCTSCTADNVFDDNTATYFDANDANGAYAGIDAGSAKVVTKIRFYPRAGEAGRMTGGKFQGSNTSSSSGFVDLYTIPSQPAYAWQEVNLTGTTAYRFLRYLAPNGGYGNVAEVEFYEGGGSSSRLSAEAKAASRDNVSIFPVPAKDHIRLQFTAPSAGKARIVIVNSIGQSQVQVIRSVVKGLNTVEVPLPVLEKGLKVVELQMEGRRLSKKIVVD